MSSVPFYNLAHIFATTNTLYGGGRGSELVVLNHFKRDVLHRCGFQTTEIMQIFSIFVDARRNYYSLVATKHG